MRELKLVAAAAALTMFGATSAQAATIINGSFETPDSTGVLSVPSVATLTGWTIVSGDIEIIADTTWQASDGSQSIDLNGWNPGSIAQTITDLIVGASYEILFAMSANPNGGAGTKTVSVAMGATSQSFNYTRDLSSGFGNENMLWAEQVLSFVAGASSQVLSFTDISGGGAASGPALDNVRIELVSEVPVPAALPLLGAGLGMMGLVGWRKKRRLAAA